MIFFEDGREAQIIGAHLVFGQDDSVELSSVTIAASPTVLDITAAQGLKPPVMYATLTMAGVSVSAAMTLIDYNQIVVSSTIRPSLENSARTRLFSSPAAALAEAVTRQFKGCCGG
jgi:hypothetical protein